MNMGYEKVKYNCVTDRLGGSKLGPIRNNGGFCAAGENFSKNDQDQWKMTDFFHGAIYFGQIFSIIIKTSKKS